MRNLLTTLAVSLVISTSTAEAHRSHTSIAEVEWNSRSQRFEIAMRLHIADLEDAVSLERGIKFRIESHPDADRQIFDYLNRRFQILAPGFSTAELHWVGKELELHDVWIYFESSLVPNRQLPSGSGETVKEWDDLFRPASGDSVSDLPGQASISSASLRKLRIRNSSLFEVQPEQKNAVSVTVDGSTSSLVLLPDKQEGVLSVVDRRKWHIGRPQQR